MRTHLPPGDSRTKRGARGILRAPGWQPRAKGPRRAFQGLSESNNTASHLPALLLASARCARLQSNRSHKWATSGGWPFLSFGGGGDGGGGSRGVVVRCGSTRLSAACTSIRLRSSRSLGNASTPETASRAASGTTNELSGVPLGMRSFGSTTAPTACFPSGSSATTALKKWVGTCTRQGFLPMSLYFIVYESSRSRSAVGMKSGPVMTVIELASPLCTRSRSHFSTAAHESRLNAGSCGDMFASVNVESMAS
mmetsp:Transcript_58066/g.160553  ORF Transcript_58066/g.160553 Transcript_58066/m.160553 type:complete len:253 (+) Transcript_58066:700-1458(+)